MTEQRNNNGMGTCAPSVYFVTFPCGIEDVVSSDLTAFSTTFNRTHPNLEVTVLSGPVKKEFMERKRHNLSNAPKRLRDSPEENLVDSPSASISPRGAVYFSVAPRESCGDGCGSLTCSGADDEFEFIYRLAFSVRGIDHVCASLDVFSMTAALEEMNTRISEKKELIREEVLGRLSCFRGWLGRQVRRNPGGIQECTGGPPVLPGLFYGPVYQSPLAGDTSVVFRANSIRRDKDFATNSQLIAAHVGDQLMECFEADGWRVNMIYHNVEFFLLHDHARTAHLGLVFSPPSFPRTGMDLDLSRQLFLEMLRQRLIRMEQAGEVQDRSALKGLVPRPAASRFELRTAKGDNAMLIPLATALVRYADAHQHHVVLDPFGGSGSTLLEHWASQALRPVAGFSGEMADEDLLRAQKNMTTTAAATCATLCGVAPEEPTPVMSSVIPLAREWLLRIESLAAAVDINGGEWTSQQLVHHDLGPEAPALLARLGEAQGRRLGSPNVSVLCADATRFPFRSGTVDRIVSDMPFGRRCGNHKINRQLYPQFLAECHRLLVSPSPSAGTTTEDTSPAHPSCGGQEAREPASDGECSEKKVALPKERTRLGDQWWMKHGDGGRAVLLTLEAKFMLETLEALRATSPFQLVMPPFAVEMGGLYPYVFVLDKLRC